MKVKPLVLATIMITSIHTSSFTREPESNPLFRDFMGINGHTVQFRPKLYAETCRLVRDYHSLGWDVGDETHYWPQTHITGQVVQILETVDVNYLR